jgi:hypothetical protein
MMMTLEELSAVLAEKKYEYTIKKITPTEQNGLTHTEFILYAVGPTQNKRFLGVVDMFLEYENVQHFRQSQVFMSL